MSYPPSMYDFPAGTAAVSNKVDCPVALDSCSKAFLMS